MKNPTPHLAVICSGCQNSVNGYRPKGGLSYRTRRHKVLYLPPGLSVARWDWCPGSNKVAELDSSFLTGAAATQALVERTQEAVTKRVESSTRRVYHRFKVTFVADRDLDSGLSEEEFRLRVVELLGYVFSGVDPDSVELTR